MQDAQKRLQRSVAVSLIGLGTCMQAGLQQLCCGFFSPLGRVSVHGCRSISAVRSDSPLSREHLDLRAKALYVLSGAQSAAVDDRVQIFSWLCSPSLRMTASCPRWGAQHLQLLLSGTRPSPPHPLPGYAAVGPPNCENVWMRSLER